MITFLRPAGFASGCSIGICGGVPRIESIMVAIIFFLIPQAVVTAQVPYPPHGYPAVAKPAPQLRKLHPNDGRGTVEMVTPGMLRLRLKAGEFWNVVPAANADIQVVGTASRELLQAGQFVNCDIYGWRCAEHCGSWTRNSRAGHEENQRPPPRRQLSCVGHNQVYE